MKRTAIIIRGVFLLGLLAFVIRCSSPPEKPLTSPYVVVLGIAQDAGFPQAACTKTCCRAVWAKQLPPQAVSCLGLVDPSSNQVWMIDATPDFVEQWQDLQNKRSKGLTQPSGIFLTHAHMGHYSGLLHLGREAMGAQAVPVYAMPRMDTFLRTNGPWSQLVELNNIDLQPLAADQAVALTNGLKITPLLVPHRDEFSETVGYRVEGPRQSLLFIPDIDKWEKWDTPIEEAIASVDYALLDGTFYDNAELPNRDMSEIPHPFIEESLARFSALPTEEKRKVNFIHLNHTNPLLRPDSKAQQELRRTPFSVAQPGQLFGL